MVRVYVNGKWGLIGIFYFLVTLPGSLILFSMVCKGGIPFEWTLFFVIPIMTPLLIFFLVRLTIALNIGLMGALLLITVIQGTPKSAREFRSILGLIAILLLVLSYLLMYNYFKYARTKGKILDPIFVIEKVTILRKQDQNLLYQ